VGGAEMDDAGRAPQHGLFTASLGAAPVAAGFSQQASFFVAFLGGPLAAVLFNAWNARIWGRLGRDLPLVVATALVALGAAVAAVIYGPQLDAPKNDLPPVRILVRVLALAIWGVFALRHRSMYRMQSISSLAPRSPWLPGLACVGVSLALFLSVVKLTQIVVAAE
jgi:hypothetical protein